MMMVMLMTERQQGNLSLSYSLRYSQRVNDPCFDLVNKAPPHPRLLLYHASMQPVVAAHPEHYHYDIDFRFPSVKNSLPYSYSSPSPPPTPTPSCCAPALETFCPLVRYSGHVQCTGAVRGCAEPSH